MRGCFGYIASIALAVGWLGASSPAEAATAGWWRFEEGSPPAIDLSGNGNTGTVAGASYSTLAPWLEGGNSLSLHFDAKSDQVEIAAGSGSNLHLFPNGVTVEAIIRPAALPLPPDGAGQRISYVVWADDGSYELVLVSDGSGRTTLRAGVNAVGGASGPCTVAVGVAYVDLAAFHHVAFSYGDETLKLFVDGKLLGSAAAPAGCGSSVGPVGFRDLVRIGNDETAVGFPSNDRAFRGWIDEVRISDVPLDPKDFVRRGANALAVASWSNSRLELWGWPGATLASSTVSLLDPRQLRLGPDGLIYAAQEGSNAVRRYDRNTGALLGSFASGPELVYPVGLAFGPDGNLYVSTHPPDILRYDGTTGAFIDVFTSGFTLTLVRAVRFGPDGHLYVGSEDQVLRFDGQTGSYIDTFTSGGPPRWLTDFVWGPDGQLYATISDYSANRVSRFDGISGVYVDDFVSSGSGGLNAPASLEFGPEGDLYVTSFQGREVLRYDGQTGAFIEAWSSHVGQVHGLLFVPEPGVLTTLAAGIGLLHGMSRRRARSVSRRGRYKAAG